MPAPTDPEDIWPDFVSLITKEDDENYIRLGDLYEILEVKGSGGYGVVLAVRHKGTEKKMGLKICKIDFSNIGPANSLKREINILHKLEH
jgi:serine/threonine protein kinase